MFWLDALQEELNELKTLGLYRECRRVEAVEGAKIRVGGRWLIHMGLNSYLGLHQHPRVIAAAKKALDQFGAGSGSARLIGGSFSLHEELEERLARFKQAEAAILFPTGYMANLGVITSLIGPGDLVIGDHLNHASIVDACRLSGAAFKVYPHRDAERLARAIAARENRYRRILIVTEGLFSMDGDIAPLPEIAKVTRRHGAILLIDDAHATGVLGKRGRGTLEHFGLSSEGIIQMGTLSKALGSLGGFVAGPRPLIDFLRNKARSFIYTTASPASCAAAGLQAIRLMEEESRLRKELWEKSGWWIKELKGLGCELVSDESPIVPVLMRETDRAVRFSKDLFEAGVYAPAIRPPTVARGLARIRTSVTALHTEEDLRQAAAAFEKAIHESVPLKVS